MIEIRRFGPAPTESTPWVEGDIDEIVAENAWVHLELLSENEIMLIVEDNERMVHIEISHQGRVPVRVHMVDEEMKKL